MPANLSCSPAAPQLTAKTRARDPMTEDRAQNEDRQKGKVSCRSHSMRSSLALSLSVSGAKKRSDVLVDTYRVQKVRRLGASVDATQYFLPAFSKPPGTLKKTLPYLLDQENKKNQNKKSSSHSLKFNTNYIAFHKLIFV